MALGAGGDQTAAIERALAEARIAYGHEAIGAMDTALRTTAEYLKTRKQFGVTLNKFQALTFRAADMYVSLELARSLALWASMVQEAGGDVVQAADRARLQVSRASRHIGKEAIQLHGGIGVTAEYSVGHYTSRLTAIDHLLGDGDWAAGPAGRERGELRDGRPAGRPVRLSKRADRRPSTAGAVRLTAESGGDGRRSHPVVGAVGLELAEHRAAQLVGVGAHLVHDRHEVVLDELAAGEPRDRHLLVVLGGQPRRPPRRPRAAARRPASGSRRSP